MKKHIREMLDNLRKRNRRDFIPPVPKRPADAATIELTPPAEPPLPADLANQELSKDPQQEVRQLDFQAHENEERETIG